MIAQQQETSAATFPPITAAEEALCPLQDARSLGLSILEGSAARAIEPIDSRVLTRFFSSLASRVLPETAASASAPRAKSASLLYEAVGLLLRHGLQMPGLGVDVISYVHCLSVSRKCTIVLNRPIP